jgi:hypothetical protein
MPDFVTLSCPTCGGKLKITPDIDRFACGNCGNEHLVVRSEGVVALKPLQESLTGLARAADRTASEMAIRRIQGEIAALQASKGPVRDKLTPLKEIEAAHKKRKDEANFVWQGPLWMAGCYLAYRLILYLEGAVEWVRLIAPLFCPWLYWIAQGGLVLGILACLWDVIFGRRPKMSTTEVENAIRAVEAELASMDETIRQREEELARHRAVASLQG